jgi:hypothetical protein
MELTQAQIDRRKVLLTQQEEGRIALTADEANELEQIQISEDKVPREPEPLSTDAEEAKPHRRKR